MRKVPKNPSTLRAGIPEGDRASGRILIFRLSSLGDIILASAALGGVTPGTRADWVIGREFEGLLAGHPLLHRVIPFNRKDGLGGWVRLCRQLWEEGYEQVYDLHRNLRTRVARGMFWGWGLLSGRRGPAWKTVPKARWKRWGHFLLKSAWPEGLRPEPWVRLFSRQIGGVESYRPDFSHLAVAAGADGAAALGLERKRYYALVPSTRWSAKEWPPGRYLEFARSIAASHPGVIPVVLGMPSDRGAVELVERLKEAGLPHVDAIGKLPWPALARVIRDALTVVGGDTGLIHLAEALGTPVVVVYGPTVPEMGFGPWREESRAVGTDLWCRPCGKDGRFCYRPLRRYHCIRGLETEPVVRAASERLSHGG